MQKKTRFQLSSNIFSEIFIVWQDTFMQYVENFDHFVLYSF